MFWYHQLVGIRRNGRASGGDPPLNRVGPYRILSRLGSGGMGIVYLADRDDGQFRMKVAVKLVACAFQDESVAARFRHERQILANLDCPNITRLLDGGVTATGSPYQIGRASCRERL